MEIIKFIRDTYWSTDYLVEKNGRTMLAKFVPNYLIKDPSKLVLKSRALRTLDRVLVPKEFVFHSDRETILIYDIDGYKPITDTEIREDSLVIHSFLRILCELIAVPRPVEPVIGADDFVYCAGQVHFFVPMFDDYSKLREILQSNRAVFASYEFLTNGSSSYWELVDVFRMFLSEMSKYVELPNEIKCLLEGDKTEHKKSFLDYCLGLSTFHKETSQRRGISFAKVRRKELPLILQKLNNSSNVFLGIVGPQRIGKTTLIGDLKVYLKEAQKFFFHPANIRDFVIQFLQIYSERLPEEYIQQLLECVDKECRLDVLKLLFLEVINYLGEDLYVIIDDYQERDVELRAFLSSLFEHVKKLDLQAPSIKLIAFSVDDYEEFSDRLILAPFSEEEVRQFVQLSIPTLKNEQVLAKWLHVVTKGLPGFIVEMMRYLVERDVIRTEGKHYYFDAAELEKLSLEGLVDNKVRTSSIQDHKYLALLGQKFSYDEISRLEATVGVKVDLNKLLEEGVIYREYGDLRFTLKQYWDALYSSIPDEERKLFHLALGDNESNLEKKAWHYEMGGFKTRAIVSYLKYVRRSIESYESFSTVAKILEHVKKQLVDRVSYAFLSLAVRTAEIYSEISTISDLKIPETNLYKLLLARIHFANANFAAAHEILSGTERYGEFGQCYKEYFRTFSLYRQTSKRSVDRRKLEEIVVRNEPKNKLWARLLGNVYFLLSLLTRDLREKSELLKKAEKIYKSHGVLERLPIIYNNLAVTTYSLPMQLKYLEKSIEAAEQLGIPAKGLHARLNLLAARMTTGRTQDFLPELRRTMQKLKLLGFKDSLGFALSLEAFYHAYNDDKESALRAINDSVRENFHHALVYKFVILALLREFEELKMEISQLSDENLDSVEDYVELYEFLKSSGTEAFVEKALRFFDSDIYYFREEMLSVFGYELALAIPGRVKKELEKLEKHYTLNQELVPLAFVYEAYGNYYKALGYHYKAEMYYLKAAKIYSEIGFYGALERMRKLYSVHLDVPAQLTSDRSENLVAQMMTALRVIDPSVQIESFLDFFLTKLSSRIPASNVAVILKDAVLEETYVLNIGTSEFLEDVFDEGERLSLSPLDVVYTVKVDEHANLTLVLRDALLSFSQDYEKTLLQMLFEVQTGMTIVLKEALGILRSFVDPLTKAWNRYRFEDALEFYFSNAVRFSGSICLIICDIDNFKKINDTYGHLVGDEVLKAVTRTIKSNVRKTDLVARFGGEEFVILLPDAKQKDGYVVANRVREKVLEIDKFPFTVSMSFGVAEFMPKLRSPTELIRLADVALYEAKKTGKNRVVIYEDGMTGGLNI